MDNELIKILDTIKGDLMDEPVVQKYLKLNKIVSSDWRLKRLKRKIEKAKNKGLSDVYMNLSTKYNEEPVIKEYNIVKNELLALLREVSTILEIEKL